MMPYKPTGNPSGRPRKTIFARAADLLPGDPGIINWAEVVGEEPPVAPGPLPSPVMLKRKRASFRRIFPDPNDGLHRPPRYGARRGRVAKRPILHPNVIAAGGVK